ncbi:hypothetical protein BDP27DRAFT_1370447 [Rhodocollybia butyracea]|uniref:Uncharacterized protein n=1 Tax=Rhodocollybia butyracea TaxID=206335 RepID=A0A9P5PE66_9AGAR|nr:hypothetical protein BDP27DRAFT_1370447 [Rhodocollybia butyracea]
MLSGYPALTLMTVVTPLAFIKKSCFVYIAHITLVVPTAVKRLYLLFRGKQYANQGHPVGPTHAIQPFLANKLLFLHWPFKLQSLRQKPPALMRDLPSRWFLETTKSYAVYRFLRLLETLPDTETSTFRTRRIIYQSSPQTEITSEAEPTAEISPLIGLTMEAPYYYKLDSKLVDLGGGGMPALSGGLPLIIYPRKPRVLRPPHEVVSLYSVPFRIIDVQSRVLVTYDCKGQISVLCWSIGKPPGIGTPYRISNLYRLVSRVCLLLVPTQISSLWSGDTWSIRREGRGRRRDLFGLGLTPTLVLYHHAMQLFENEAFIPTTDVTMFWDRRSTLDTGISMPSDAYALLSFVLVLQGLWYILFLAPDCPFACSKFYTLKYGPKWPMFLISMLGRRAREAVAIQALYELVRFGFQEHWEKSSKWYEHYVSCKDYPVRWYVEGGELPEDREAMGLFEDCIEFERIGCGRGVETRFAFWVVLVRACGFRFAGFEVRTVWFLSRTYRRNAYGAWVPELHFRKLTRLQSSGCGFGMDHSSFLLVE